MPSKLSVSFPNIIDFEAQEVLSLVPQRLFTLLGNPQVGFHICLLPKILHKKLQPILQLKALIIFTGTTKNTSA